MTPWRKVATVVSTTITIVLGVPLAAILLLFGIVELIHPDVPESELTLNTVACLTAILIGLAILLGVGFVIRRRLQEGQRPPDTGVHSGPLP